MPYLQVFHGGIWGAVCDDRFTAAAARVACRQLGLSGGEPRCCGAFGPSPGPMLLDELACAGDEARLEQCRSSGWGRHDCKPAEAVGVRCSGPQSPATPATPPSTPGDYPYPDAVTSPPAPPADASSAGADLVQAPPVRCLALPPDNWVGAGDCSLPYFYGPYDALYTSTSYRVVYAYDIGARSCPSSLRVTVTAGPDKAGPGMSIDVPAIRPDEGRVYMIQRRGLVSTVRDVGPAWVKSLWIDFKPLTRAIDAMQPEILYYNASEGRLSRSGPAVAGWLWRYGSAGLTDGYSPSTFPDLSCSEAGGGINATYQLVYEIRYMPRLSSEYTVYSYPSPDRFRVYDEAASTPLVLYVQLASAVHPPDMAALLLQRVEGDAVWTVARLAAGDPALGPGRRFLLFNDTTSRATWGCPFDSDPPEETKRRSPPPGDGSQAVDGEPPPPYEDLDAGPPPPTQASGLRAHLYSGGAAAAVTAGWSAAGASADEGPPPSAAVEGASPPDGDAATAPAAPRPPSPAPPAKALISALPPSSLPTAPQPPQPPQPSPTPPVTCRAVLEAQWAVSASGDLQVAFRTATLDCWNTNGAGGPVGSAPPPPSATAAAEAPLVATVEVGRHLAPFLRHSGVRVVLVGPNDTAPPPPSGAAQPLRPPPAAPAFSGGDVEAPPPSAYDFEPLDGGGSGGAFAAGGGNGGAVSTRTSIRLPSPSALRGAQVVRRHFGIALSGVSELTVVDSMVAGLPLSPYGPLLECRSCGSLLVRNLTLRNLTSPLASVASASWAASGSSSSSSRYVYGVAAASGVSRAALSDFTCSGVAGASSWACLLVDYQDVVGGTAHGQAAAATAPAQPLEFSLTSAIVSGNRVTAPAGSGLGLWHPPPAAGGAAANPLLERLERAAKGSAGAIALLAQQAAPSLPPSPSPPSGGAAAAASANAAGWQGEDDDATRPLLALYVSDSVLSRNSGGAGGAIFSSAPTVAAALTRSTLTGNGATTGGALCFAGGDVTRIAIQEGSRLDGNTATIGGALHVGATLFSLTLEGGSSMSGNTAYEDGGAMGQIGVGVAHVETLYDNGTYQYDVDELQVSHSASMSYNSANTAAVLGLPARGARLRRLLVTAGGRMDGNVAQVAPGVVRCGEACDHVEVSGYGSSMSYNRADFLDFNNLGGGVLSAEFIGSFLVDAGASVSHNTVGNPERLNEQFVSRNIGDGGVVWARSVGALAIRGAGSAAANNTARKGDGGLLRAGRLGLLDVSGGGQLVRNSAGRGGAVYVDVLGSVNITSGAHVSDNTARQGAGGALFVSGDITGGIAIVDGAKVELNVAEDAGDGSTATDGGGGFAFVGQSIRGRVLVADGARLCGCGAAGSGGSGGAIRAGESINGGMWIGGGGAVVCSNAAHRDGGAVYAGVSVGGLAMWGGGRLEGNVAGGAGGALFAGRTLRNVTLAGGASVAHNTAGSDGGALYADAILLLHLTDNATATGNTAGGDGGFARGAVVTSASLTRGGSLRANRAGRSGGALAAASVGSLTLSDGAVASGNVAAADGGLAAASRIGTLAVVGSEVAANVAGGSGGAVSLAAVPAEVLVAGSRLTSNVAERGAGGVLSVSLPAPGSPLLGQTAGSGRLTVSDGSLVYGNGAYLDGGAFSVAAQAASDPTGEAANLPYIELMVELSDSAFEANYASGGGGALALASPSAGALLATLAARNCSFVRNAAGSEVFRIGSSPTSGLGGALALVSSPKFRADAAREGTRGSLSLSPQPDRQGLEQGSLSSPPPSPSLWSSIVSLDSACRLRLQGCRFESNLAQGHGGAVAAVSCPAAVEGCTFVRNKARLGGGGLAAMVELVDGSDIASQVQQRQQQGQEQGQEQGQGQAPQQEAPGAASADGGEAPGSGGSDRSTSPPLTQRRRQRRRLLRDERRRLLQDRGADGGSSDAASAATQDSGAAQGLGDPFADAERLLGGLPPYHSWWLAVSGGTVFQANVAALGCGGGLYAEVAAGAGATLGGCLFEGNEARDQHGGGACLIGRGEEAEAAAVIHAGTRLQGNVARRRGGGIYAELIGSDGEGGGRSGGGGGGMRLAVDGVALAGNIADEGGALFVGAAKGFQAALTRVEAYDNTAATYGGAVYVQCGETVAAIAAAVSADPTAAGAVAAASRSASCGTDPLLTLRGCNLTGNAALAAAGGGLFTAAGSSVALYDSDLNGNRAGEAGGGIAAVGCESLILGGGRIWRSVAARFGGGVFVHACARTLLVGTQISDNAALTGGGAYFAGPGPASPGAGEGLPSSPPPPPPSPASLDPSTLATRAAALVRVENATFVGNLARAGGAASGSAPGGSGASGTGSSGSYQPFGGHGGGVFASGEVSVLLSGCDLSRGNTAVVGSAVASSQGCDDPRFARSGFERLIAAAPPPSGQEGEGATAATATLAADVPLWMQDPVASALQARCSGGGSGGDGAPSAAAASLQAELFAAGCLPLLRPELSRACELLAMLAPCSSLLPDSTASPSPANDGGGGGLLAGSLVDSSPTHLRLESGSGALRPGVVVRLSVRLYNGLAQPMQRDTLPLRVTVSIAPADRDNGGPVGTGAAAGAATAGWAAHLRPAPQRPWQDVTIALLDPGAAVGGSLTVPVVDGAATWPYLTVRGWPGRYLLVFTAASEISEYGMIQAGGGVAPLVVPVRLLPCGPGEALDLTWAQQPGAQPSWLSCRRCERGRFTLWRDARPQLWDLDAANYMDVIRDTSNSLTAAGGDATCLSCPAHAACLGGAVMVPDQGRWHSAPDSALFHRCPKEDACGQGADQGAGWAALPAIPLDTVRAAARMGDPQSASAAPPATANASASGDSTAGGSNGDGSVDVVLWAAAAAGGAQMPAMLRTAPFFADPRAGWLSLCQQVGYLATELAEVADAVAGSSGNTSTGAVGGGDDADSGDGPRWEVLLAPPLAAADEGRSVAEFVGACALLWSHRQGKGPGGGGGGGGGNSSSAGLYLQTQCAEGYSGPLCAACVPGYFINSEFECSTSISLAVLAFLGGLALVLYTLVTNLRENFEEDEEQEGLEADEGGQLQLGAAAIAKGAGLERRGSGNRGAAAADEATASDYLKVAIVHAQYYIIITRLPVTYPDLISRLSGAASAVTGAESTVAFSYSCLFPDQPSDGQARAQLLGALLVPGVVVAASGLLWSFREVRDDAARSTIDSGSRSSDDKAAVRARSLRSQHALRRAWGALLAAARGWLRRSGLVCTLTRVDATLGLGQQLRIVGIIAVFILYPGWAQAALSVFACYRVDDGVTGPFPDRQQATWRYGYWVRDMAQQCYSGAHLSLYVPIGVAAVAAVCLGPPLASLALLLRHRRRLGDQHMRQRYGFLYTRYRPRYFWWESVLMLEELALVAVEVFGRGLPVVAHQVLLMLAAFIALSLINMACAPARSRTIVLLEFLSMGVLSLTVTLTLYFVAGDLEPGAADAVGLLIMLLNAALLAAFLSLVLRRSWGTVRRRGAQLLGLARRISRGGSSGGGGSGGGGGGERKEGSGGGDAMGGRASGAAIGAGGAAGVILPCYLRCLVRFMIVAAPGNA
ncbi:hypothetical protein GPECTOR_31g310 [Gonium pectorale]|uniref:SRCR domain-containing protein n=1 Tax=Gonium pectorale TaxID=33097 RepID=A0A150GDQ6_GONPE|nr:hypothetical protein GPECTOR_31g310 [Gonium pectorale]|eukprot:KXZ47948.1 hypothetical protein GPECTOR_31g310 [Gonium pectorale]